MATGIQDCVSVSPASCDLEKKRSPKQDRCGAWKRFKLLACTKKGQQTFKTYLSSVFTTTKGLGWRVGNGGGWSQISRAFKGLQKIKFPFDPSDGKEKELT